jgi:Ca2+-binding RTX toxin-like protein
MFRLSHCDNLLHHRPFVTALEDEWHRSGTRRRCVADFSRRLRLSMVEVQMSSSFVSSSCRPGRFAFLSLFIFVGGFVGAVRLPGAPEPAVFAQSVFTPRPLTSTPPSTRGLTCRGEAATAVVGGGEEFSGGSERDVVVVIGNGAEVWTNLGDDLVCVYGNADGDAYGHGSIINLGPGNNTIITYGGSNYITAGDGNDFIYLNGEVEDVDAGEGNDHIWALGAASATVKGGDGNDLLVGSPGRDHFDGGADTDVLMGNGGDDELKGGDGNDTLYGNAGVDDLMGEGGQDECIDNLPGGAILSSCEIQSGGGPGLPEAGGKATP